MKQTSRAAFTPRTLDSPLAPYMYSGPDLVVRVSGRPLGLASRHAVAGAAVKRAIDRSYEVHGAVVGAICKAWGPWR